MSDCAILIIVVIVLLWLYMPKERKTAVDIREWTCKSDKGDSLTFKTPMKSAMKRDNATFYSQSQVPQWGYDQVKQPETFQSPEGFSLNERMRSNMTGDSWDPDVNDQVAAYHDITPPAWSSDSLLYYGAVDQSVIQNHKAFISENWMFNQNANFADFGDAPNYPYPVTSIRLNAINNVPTDTNPHQITEDQDEGSRNTYTDKQICYGLVN